MNVHFNEFEWDDGNEGHIARHRVSPTEVEELFEDFVMAVPAYNKPGLGFKVERRRAIIGRTGSGRLLIIVFTLVDRILRPISARDATTGERRRYRQWRR